MIYKIKCVILKIFEYENMKRNERATNKIPRSGNQHQQKTHDDTKGKHRTNSKQQ